MRQGTIIRKTSGPVIEDGTTTGKITPVVPAPTSGGAAVKAVGMK